MKRSLALLMAVLTALSVCACSIVPADKPVSATYAQAFRSMSMPEGSFDEDTVCFYRTLDGEHDFGLLSEADMLAYDDGGFTPRMTFYDKFFDTDALWIIANCVSYALKSGYTRFSLSPAGTDGESMNEAVNYLKYAFPYCSIQSALAYTATTPVGREAPFYLVVVKNEYWERDDEKDRQAYDAAAALVKEASQHTLSEPEMAVVLYAAVLDRITENHGESSGNSVIYDTLTGNDTGVYGYALTLAYLYERAGFKSLIISSYTSDGSVYWWVIARVNGKYYNFDPFMDYMFYNEGRREEERLYFCGISTDALVSQSIYQKYRVDGIMPECTSMLAEEFAEKSEF